MRLKPLRQSQKGAPVAKPLNWVAPVGGWHTDKPIAALPPDAAFALVNWFPEAGYIRARNGSTSYATGLPGSVGTLMPYSGATNKLFAASGAGIYDVSSAGAVGAALVSGLTSAHWSNVQFTNSGGKWLIACNGNDAPQIYNGASFAALSVTGPASINKLSAVCGYRSRLWFLEAGTTRLWYGATDAIAGALTSLEVGDVMQLGGTLVAISSWTVPISTGVMQFLVLFSTQGELVVYQGSNPGDATNWSLLGTFKVAYPLGLDRSLQQIGGDLAIMTVNGIVPASKAITIDPSSMGEHSLTKNIAPTWRDIVQTIGAAASGWEFCVYAQGRQAIINVPDPSAGVYQLVMNTETLAWTKFVGMVATTWCSWNGGLYFGTAGGAVAQADYGGNDLGAAIDCLAVGSWQRLSDGMQAKQTTMMTVDALLDANAAISAAISWNYVSTTPAPGNITSGASSVAKWGTAVWGIDAWPGEFAAHLVFPADGIGFVFAPTVRALISGSAGSPADAKVIGGAIYVQPGAA